MKSKIGIVFMIALVFSMSTICFATNEEETTDIILDTQVVDTQNEEEIYEELIYDENSDIQYIEDYEDYEDLAAGQSQDELKDYYESYQEYMKDYFNSYQREDPLKAKVIEVSAIEEEYEYNEYYYSASKYVIQPIKVEVLEGEHAGEQHEISYLLTGDSLGNIQYADLKVGDTIFVSFYTDETTGEVYADITNVGANVERLGVIICIGIIALIFLIIYGGRKGLLTALIILLALDFTLVIIPTMGFEGQGFIIGGIAFILLLIATMVITKLGLTKKALKAGGISIVMTLLTWVILAVANYLTRTIGITFEIAAIAENVILNNMNFENLYFVITLIIAAVTVTNIACNALKKIEETNVEGFNERLEVCKSVLNENVLIAVITLLAIYIPNHLLLLTNKYTSEELWNAELLITELVRIFVVISASSITVPFVVASKEVERERLKEAKKEGNNSEVA